MTAKPSDEFSLVGVKQITENGDSVPEFASSGNRVTNYASISKNCKNIELALRFLDYGFTEEGMNVYNFGIEGESYEIKDGEPVFTELITNNPDGLTFADAVSAYVRANSSGPFIQDERYVIQSLSFPDIQKSAYDKWSVHNMNKHLLPSITPSVDESARVANIMATIKPYVEEMTAKFITGDESLEQFDNYLKQLDDFGLSGLLDAYSASLERYNKR